jgi:hypothetical protein
MRRHDRADKLDWRERTVGCLTVADKTAIVLKMLPYEETKEQLVMSMRREAGQFDGTTQLQRTKTSAGPRASLQRPFPFSSPFTPTDRRRPPARASNAAFLLLSSLRSHLSTSRSDDTRTVLSNDSFIRNAPLESLAIHRP